VAELFADGEATPDRLDVARRDAALAYQKARVFVRNGNMFGAGRAARPKPMHTYKAFGTGACLCAAGVDPYSSPEEPEGPSILDWQDAAETALEAGAKWHVELSAICGLLRDVFGNPFRPIAFSPEWRSATAVSVARRMYEAHDFSALPELADALQDARCDNADILDHCRGPGPHVRGCWVVDLVLGKQ
jgi:hypothetical protein